MKYNVFPLIFLVLVSLSLPATASTRPHAEEIDHIVAVVNNDVITQTELSRQTRMIKERLQQAGKNLPPDAILEKQILEQMILQRIQLQIAQRAGIRVDDETINKVISNIARENRLNLQQFRQVLAQDGYQFDEFREKIKDEIIINRLQQKQVQSRVAVTPREVDYYLKNLANRENANEEFHVAQILIPLPDGATPAQIKTTRLKAEAVHKLLLDGDDFAKTAMAVSRGRRALEGGDLGWLKGGELPPIFSKTVFEMQPGMISDVIRSANGFHIVKLLGRRSPKDTKLIQQTMARHILIAPDEITSSEDARLRLEQIRERLIAGDDFGAIARNVSDDPGSAANGGSLGWVSPGKMVPEFEAQMNRLKPGEISQPFQTQFGWHIVQVMSRRQYDDSKESARLKARQIIGKRKTDEALQNWIRQIRSEAYVELRTNQ